MCLITQIYWHIIYHQRQPQCCNKISWSAFIQLRTSSFFITNTVKLCYLRHYFNKKKLASTTKANIIHSIAYPWLSFKKFTVRVREIWSKIFRKCDTLCITSSKFLCYRLICTRKLLVSHNVMVLSFGMFYTIVYYVPQISMQWNIIFVKIFR